MQTESLDLVVINKLNSSELFRVGTGVDELIEYVKTRAYEVPQDVSTPEARAAMKSQAYLISKCKRPVEDAKKRESAELKIQTKAIDANGKKIVDAISAIHAEYKKPLTEYEENEKNRIEDFTNRIIAIREHATDKRPVPNEYGGYGEPLTSIELENMLAELGKIKLGECWDEFADEAELAIKESSATLVAYIERAKKAETEAAELERLRKAEEERKEKERLEKEAKEKKEREERIAKEAAERAKKEADEKARLEREESERKIRKAQEAAEKAERDRIAAEERAKHEKEEAIKREQERAKAEAERVEQERIAKEKAEQEVAERKARNARHRTAVYDRALDAFLRHGVEHDNAKKVMMLIDQGEIPDVTINY